MTRRAPSRSFASYLAFFIIFAALFVGGIAVTFFVAPLFALTPLQWGFALVLTLLTGIGSRVGDAVPGGRTEACGAHSFGVTESDGGLAPVRPVTTTSVVRRR